MRKTFLLAIPFLLLSGCAYFAADRYAVSVDGHEQAKKLADAGTYKKPSVGRFTASKPGLTQLPCRAGGYIETVDRETFESYIEKAFADQLRFAGLYDQASTTVISGKIDHFDFNSGDGVWNIVLTLHDNAGRSFTVTEDYRFRGSFDAQTACDRTAQALMPAVQNVVRKAVSDPGFKAMLAPPRA